MQPQLSIKVADSQMLSCKWTSSKTEAFHTTTFANLCVITDTYIEFNIALLLIELVDLHGASCSHRLTTKDEFSSTRYPFSIVRGEIKAYALMFYNLRRVRRLHSRIIKELIRNKSLYLLLFYFLNYKS